MAPVQQSQRIPIAMRRRLGNAQLSELVVIDADGGNRQVIYEVAELIEAPNWTPDGSWLIFNADGRLFRIPPTGGSPHRSTPPRWRSQQRPLLSPDGKT